MPTKITPVSSTPSEAAIPIAPVAAMKTMNPKLKKSIVYLTVFLYCGGASLSTGAAAEGALPAGFASGALLVTVLEDLSLRKRQKQITDIQIKDMKAYQSGSSAMFFLRVWVWLDRTAGKDWDQNLEICLSGSCGG